MTHSSLAGPKLPGDPSEETSLGPSRVGGKIPVWGWRVSGPCLPQPLSTTFDASCRYVMTTSKLITPSGALTVTSDAERDPLLTRGNFYLFRARGSWWP